MDKFRQVGQFGNSHQIVCLVSGGRKPIDEMINRQVDKGGQLLETARL